MSEPFVFRGKRVLLDVTVTAVTAGATHQTAITGSLTNATGTSQITAIGSANALQSTSLSGLFGDLTDIIVVPPVASDGTFPDVYIWPVVDGIDLRHYIEIDASVDRNMMPNASNTVGYRHVAVGIPYREAVERQLSNLPLKVTGLKAVREYRFSVFSTAGWSSPTVPLRIIGLGDKLNTSALEQIASHGYSGNFFDRVPPFEAFSGVHQLPGGGLSAKSWSALPGGTNQSSLKIHRFFRQAINRVATSASTPFIMSTQNALGGTQGNVNDDEDLGFDFAQGDKYLRVLELGIRPNANSAFWGVKVDDTILPGDTPSGTPVTQGVNPYAYGNVQPQRPDSGLYFALPKSPFPVVAYKNKLAFFIVANGTAIPANGESIALGGIYVEQAH